MAYAKPKTTAELNELATVSVDHNIPIRQYFRSADVLIKQARIYRSEGDLEQAYILYMKYINLGLTELPKHAGYKNAANKRQLKTIKNNCLEALDALEQMKVQLDTAYRSYHDARARSDMETKQLVEETEEKELAAKNDHRKRDEKTLAEDDDDKTQQENKEQDTESTKIYQEPESWSLQEALKGVAGISNQPSTTTVYRPLLATLTTSSTTYPTYLQRNQSDGFVYSGSGSSNNTASAQQPAAATPRVPPKLFDYKRPSPPLSKPTGLSPSAPPLPPKVKLGDDMVADIDPQQQQQPKQSAPALPPKVALAAPPEETSTSLATTEGGLPLRMLDIPSGLKKRFLSIAESNTMKNVETCGILCGKLKNNRFTMTTLVIPKQQGTSDTCTTENEEEVFEFQDANNLLTFGWIHTHPSQSCFLSSLDLHTHCSYQLMLPEAVAIVCAPKHQPDFGVFRLTNPPGVEIISSCKKEGVFHPHPDMPIYTDTHDDVGHVRVKDYDFKVVDLRK